MSNSHALYVSCPQCGSAMKLVGGKWMCPVCGYVYLRRIAFPSR